MLEEIFLKDFLKTLSLGNKLPLDSLTCEIHYAQLGKSWVVPEKLAGGCPLQAVALPLGAWCPT